MIDLLESLDGDDRDKLRRQSVPASFSPMLATLVDEPVEGEEWMFERKLDGVRLVAIVEDGKVRLRTRNDQDRDGTYPELVEALEAMGLPDVVADGEVVAFDGDQTSFSRLQARLGVSRREDAREPDLPVHLYLFDLVHLDGYDLAGLPLRRRKSLLRELIDWKDPIRYTQHRNAHGGRYLREACEAGWEGLIAKRADSTYVHARSRDWLKLKCSQQQELVIGGWTEPAGERIGFGALLLGYYENDALCYAGKVGTGFDDATLRELHGRLQRIERTTAPFQDHGDIRGDVHWATPRLVAEVGFTEWTRDGKLRHPRFLGLREDKPAQEVVRERPR